MEFYERIAQEIFQTYYLDFQDATRAGGWSNYVWINHDKVLRLSTNRDSDKITREVMVSRYLPKEVGYPENIAIGRTEGFEWSLSKRIIGQPLSEVWNLLSFEERLSCVKQMISIVKAVHSVDVSKLVFTHKTSQYIEQVRELVHSLASDFASDNLLSGFALMHQQFFLDRCLRTPDCNVNDVNSYKIICSILNGM